MNVIQDTWNELDDQDLLEHLKNNALILSRDEILKVNPKEFNCIYADTSVIQAILKCSIPDTYPSELKEFYGRDIVRISVDRIRELKNVFVKPVGNSKAFEASLIRNEYDITQLLDEIGNETEVYVSNLVEFVNEYRIFYANGTYDSVDSSEYLISYNKIQKVEPPTDFLQQLFETPIFSQHPYNICIVDVGMLSNGAWVVVEVNPPFAITSYNYDIEKYHRFCSLAWGLYTSQS